jgi:hypothetical protein
MQWVSNKCGGARFRTLPDHSVEIEGQGVPTYAPGSPEHKYLTQTWRNWSGVIRKHAKKTGLPVSNVLAIATKETGLWSGDKHKQATIGSPAGAQGIMQVMPCNVFQYGKFKDLVCGRNRSDPDTSLNMGSVLLQAHMKNYGGFPAAASAYNAGGLKCYTGPTGNSAVKPNKFNWLNEHDYASKATTYNNTAVLMGVNEGPLWPWLVGGITVAGAALYFVHRNKPLRKRLLQS